MGRQEQWEAYQDMTAKYREACDELRQALAELDEARAIPNVVYVVTKNGEMIIGVFDTKEKAVAEMNTWEVSDDISYGVREMRVR